jgi:hypothetical protein
MTNAVRIIGLHPVPADMPVHLIELELGGDIHAFNFGEVTQELPTQPRENWQVAYHEREVGRDGNRVRFAFFFHYLDLAKPLLTPFGTVWLPAESGVPQHLQFVKYEQP